MSKFKPNDRIIRVGKVPVHMDPDMTVGSVYTVTECSDVNVSVYEVGGFWDPDQFALYTQTADDDKSSEVGWRDITPADLITLGNILAPNDYEVRIQVRVRSNNV